MTRSCDRSSTCWPKVYPETRTASEIVQAIATAGTAIGHAEGARILDALFKSVIGGMTVVRALPLRIGSSLASTPLAWRVARDDVAAQRAWTTNLAHERVALDGLSKFLVGQLDGSADRAILVDRLASAMTSGELPPSLPSDSVPLAEQQGVRGRAASLVDQALLRFEKSALLEANTT